MKLGDRNLSGIFENNHLIDLNRIDGESMGFEWKIFPRFTTFDFLEQNEEFMKEQKCDPEQFKCRIIFMSMFNDIVWGETGHEEKCTSNAHEVADYARRFLRVLGLGSEKKWYGTCSDTTDGVWDTTAEDVMLELAKTMHPTSVLPVPLKEKPARGNLSPSSPSSSFSNWEINHWTTRSWNSRHSWWSDHS